MSERGADIRFPLGLARRYAALSGKFDPKAALRRSIRGNSDVAAVASLLASACDTDPANGEGCWLMRMPERRFELRTLYERRLLEKTIRWRRAHGTDPEADDLHAVLLDASPLTSTEIESAIDGESRSLLERIVVALDRAGDFAPSAALLPAVRSAIAMLDQRKRLDDAAKRPFVGRVPERGEVRAWLQRPIMEPPVTCLYLEGGPSIGKSSLLAQAVAEFHQGRQPLILRFDFDWAGLDVQDRVGFTMEAARQLAQQLGRAAGDLFEARLDAASRVDTDIKSAMSSRDYFPAMLAGKMVEALSAVDRPLLVVLDTLEVLRGRGETHPRRLFEWLDDMVRAGVGPLRVIAAGRGEALDGCSDRIGRPLAVESLDAEAAGRLLERFAVPQTLRPKLLALAEGNPLKLTLLAEIVAGGEAAWLRGRRRKKEISATFLYRFLLSRVEEPDLRRIVNPGLILRRVNTDIIHEVLAKVLRLRHVTRQRAEALMQDLEALHWLVQRDPEEPGFLMLRPAMRSLLLPLLYGAAPKTCAAINRAAALWFDRHHAPWAKIDALIHRLQLLRVQSQMPDLDWSVVIKIDRDALGELPRKAQDAVLAARGERTGRLRTVGPVSRFVADPGIVRELFGILRRKDWQEGRYLVEKIMSEGSLDPTSEVADAVRAYLWRSGRWSEALALLQARDQAGVGDDDLEALPWDAVLTRIEMRAEFQPRRLLGRLKLLDLRFPEMREAAMAATDDVARYGATAFLFAHAFNRALVPAGRREFDPVGTAIVLNSTDEDPAFLRGAVELARGRFRSEPILANYRGDLPDGVLVASLTPYAAVARNHLAGRSGDERATVHAAGVRDRLAAYVGLPSEAFARGGDPVTTLTGFGVFAEWAAAFGHIGRDPDLRCIGLAAERWRRTMAGDWRYGRPPFFRERPDRTLRQRIDDLNGGPDPVGAALAWLGVWSSEGGEHLLATLRWRHCRTLAGAAEVRSKGPYAVAVRLLDSRMPSAFVPALAVLICRE